MTNQPPKRTVRNSVGITSCCHKATYKSDGDEFCVGCKQPVQIRIVETENGELLMMAGAQPCGDSMPIPRKRKRRKPKPRTTARHGRGKGIRR